MRKEKTPRKSFLFGEQLKAVKSGFGHHAEEQTAKMKMRMKRKALKDAKEDRKLSKFDHLLKGYPKTMKRMILGYGVPVATIETG